MTTTSYTRRNDNIVRFGLDHHALLDCIVLVHRNDKWMVEMLLYSNTLSRSAANKSLPFNLIT